MHSLRDSNLVFIISQPRSGSTLLQAILSTHSKVDTTSEHWLLLPLLSIFKPELIEAKYDFELAIDAFWDFQNKIEGIESFRQEYKNFLLYQYSKIQSNPGNLIIDKTPRYYEIFDAIFDFFPNSKFILLKRHPLAVFKSIMSTWNRYKIHQIARCHCRDLFVAPHLIQKWVDMYKGRKNVVVLKFEDFVKNSSESIRELSDWLEIEFQPSMLDYSKNKSYIGKYGDPIGVYEKSTPERDNAEKWRDSLNRPLFRSYLNGYGAHLGKEFLSRYGYEEKDDYLITLRFKLFRYYCRRSQYLTNYSFKDRIVRVLLEKVFKESLNPTHDISTFC